MTTTDFERLFEQIHDLTKTTARLNLVFRKLSLDSELAENFRRRQRRWQETLLTELTYISAIGQSPVSIMESHIHHAAKNRGKYDQYGLLRGNFEYTLITIHAKKELHDRSNFSELLEQLQRAQNYGYRTRTAIRNSLQGYCWQATYQGFGWRQRETQSHYRLFLNRPSLEGNFFKNVDNLPKLGSFFQQMRELEPRHFSAFHAILSLCERITTYLLLLIGRHDILVAKSWVKLHLPAVWPAYERLFSSKTHAPELPDILECFVKMVDLLLHVVDTSFSQVQFKYSGDKGKPIQSILLLRRCFDVIIICILNMHLNCPSEPQTDVVWVKTRFVLSAQQSHVAGHRLGIFLPPASGPNGLLDCFLRSLAIYEGKEGLCLLQRPPSNIFIGRDMMNTLQAYHVPVISLVNEVETFSARSNTQGDSRDIQPRADATSTETEETLFTNEQRLAAAVIIRIWRHYWPLHKERTLFSVSPLGRATAYIDDLYKTLRAVDVEGQYPETLHAFWWHGPVVYHNILEAERTFHEVSELYQSFFGTLLGANYSDEDLDEVENYFEKVQEHGKQIENYKECFTKEGITKYWKAWEVNGETGCQRRLERLAGAVGGILKDLELLTENRFVKDVEI